MFSAEQVSVIFKKCLTRFSLQDLPVAVVCNEPLSRALEQTGLLPPPLSQSVTDWVASVAISHYDWWAPWRSAAPTGAAASLVRRSKWRNMSAFWPPTNATLPTGGERDGILWAEVCSLLVLARKKSLWILTRRRVRVCLLVCCR